jgi:hypothetical protein
MQFSVVQAFPAGLDRLWAVFGRRDYPTRKYLAMGASAVRIARFEAGPSAIAVDLARDVPVDPARVPGWARALVGTEQTLAHRTVWRREDPTHVSAELDIEPVGLPVRAHGSGSIVQTPAGDACMTLHWRVTSGVPVMGRNIERLFAEQIRAALADDHAFTLQYLESAPP